MKKWLHYTTTQKQFLEHIRFFFCLFVFLQYGTCNASLTSLSTIMISQILHCEQHICRFIENLKPLFREKLLEKYLYAIFLFKKSKLLWYVII